MMKFKVPYLIYFIALLSLLTSCKNHSKKREKEAEQIRANQKQDSIFNKINNAWLFSIEPFNAATLPIMENWNEWQNFQSELTQKPTSTISAFQQKAKGISVQANTLNKKIPSIFKTPQIKSRITAIVTKINALESLIKLDKIPDERIVTLIHDINIEIGALQQRMQITTKRTNDRLEEGEAEMLKSLIKSQQK